MGLKATQCEGAHEDGGPMKILIVEDDAASLETLSDTAVSQGYETCTAEDGAIGLEMFNEFKPDVVLTDIQMPKKDGLALLEDLRRSDSETIVVIMTAFGSEDYAMRALQLGANNYLQKPIRHRDLLPLLDKYKSVVEARDRRGEVSGLVLHRGLTLEFDNRMERVTAIVDYLIAETNDAIPKGESLGIRLGLVELINNAIEHGNLGIGFEEKSAALEEGPGALQSLYEARLDDPALAQRRVKVDFKMDPTGCEWVIADEGEGFDQSAIPDPTDTERLLSSHGRGIFLTRLKFDELEYLGAGNTVRARMLRE